MTIYEKTNQQRFVQTDREELKSSEGFVLTGPAIRLDVVNAYRDTQTAAVCYRNKLACYARFGVSVASVALPEEIEDGSLYLITATDCGTQDIIGGISIYVRSERSALPVEKAIGAKRKMAAEIKSWQGRSVMELSGFWAEDTFRKTGLSEQIVHTAIAAANVMRADKIVAFGHHHLVPFYETLGVLQDLRLGSYHYPNRQYISTVLYADPIGFMTVPVDKRPAVVRFAETLARGEPIMWRNFQTKIAR